MANLNHYETLNVSTAASQAEIKQAYRRLVKLFHPDSNSETANREQMVRINAAYEILSDRQSRQSYDRQLNAYTYLQNSPSQRQQRTAAAQNHYRASQQTGRDADEHLEQWLQQVYQPVARHLDCILDSLEDQLDRLAADPFADELIEEFQAYLETCRDHLKQANVAFRSMPNPPSVAGTAAHLYYCLNQLGDGVEQLEFFPLNYDEHYLHMGQELFRIASSLLSEAHFGLEAMV